MIEPQPQDLVGEFLLYTTDDGQAKLEVRLVEETVWLSQKQLAELFQKDVRTISEHIRNLFAEAELAEPSVVRDFRITAADGKTYKVVHYNLDVCISVGYRVKSHRGTQFRIWATQRLREYLIKGFAMDDDRLKRVGGGNYFDELLARIRDIRSSEKVFWRKVLDIYATSIDYDPRTEASQTFFATVQNKMHWAAHGHTAAEIVFQRADAEKAQMGMTSFAGTRPTKSEAAVAKNYLNAAELDALNRIVNMYLEFAELQVLGRKPMYMADWISKLDDFLRISDRDLLSGAGSIAHEEALRKAQRLRQIPSNSRGIQEYGRSPLRSRHQEDGHPLQIQAPRPNQVRRFFPKSAEAKPMAEHRHHARLVTGRNSMPRLRSPSCGWPR